MSMMMVSVLLVKRDIAAVNGAIEEVADPQMSKMLSLSLLWDSIRVASSKRRDRSQIMIHTPWRNIKLVGRPMVRQELLFQVFKHQTHYCNKWRKRKYSGPKDRPKWTNYWSNSLENSAKALKGAKEPIHLT